MDAWWNNNDSFFQIIPASTTGSPTSFELCGSAMMDFNRGVNSSEVDEKLFRNVCLVVNSYHVLRQPGQTCTAYITFLKTDTTLSCRLRMGFGGIRRNVRTKCVTSVWTKIINSVNKNYYQCEQKLLSVWTKIIISVNKNYYQCEQKLLSVWTKIIISVNKNYYQCEQKLLSVWTKIIISVNKNYYQCEQKLLSVWTKIIISVNKNYYQCEQKLLSVWTKIIISVNKNYYQCEQKFIIVWRFLFLSCFQLVFNLFLY